MPPSHRISLRSVEYAGNHHPGAAAAIAKAAKRPASLIHPIQVSLADQASSYQLDSLPNTLLPDPNRIVRPAPFFDRADRPILQIEPSQNRILGKTALVKVEKAKIVSTSEGPKALERTKTSVLSRVRENKLATAIGGTVVAGQIGWAYLLYTFPVQMGLFILGSLGFLVSVGLISWKGPQAKNYLGTKGRRFLAGVTTLPERLLSKKDLPALPGEQDSGAPFRSPEIPISVQRVPELSARILKPIYEGKNYGVVTKRQNEIRSLGKKLQDLPVQSFEFQTGLQALLQVLEKPPVIRYSSPFWKNSRRSLSLAALEALVNATSHLNKTTIHQDPPLSSIAETVLKKLSSREMLEFIYRNNGFNKTKSREEVERLRNHFEAFTSREIAVQTRKNIKVWEAHFGRKFPLN